MGLPERMIKYRAKENLTQKELAEKCGLSTQTIYHVENGVQNPNKITKAKIELIVGEGE